MRRQISAVCMLRIAFLSNLFAYRRGVIYHVPLQRGVHCMHYLFLGDFLSVINHVPSADAYKLYYAMLILN